MKRLGTNPKWCKGCGLCVAFCPKNVLSLEKDKICVSDAENCVFCGTCDSLCPDLAIFIYEEENENA